MSDPNLVTTCHLHGQDYLVKMNVVQNYLELAVTDKQSGEEWQCSYDSAFVESLTHKTGNFKQFDIFVTMLKSGLLKTSSCVALDLLTYDDLETLRVRKLKTNPVRTLNSSRSNNRRYLILTYTVEFDRIHYPLPLEYSGPPDPTILQATIKKLENELQDAQSKSASGNKNDFKDSYVLQKRIEELEYENDELRGEIYRLKKQMNTKPKKQMQEMQRAITNLERSVVSERKSHHRLVEQLRNEKVQLHRELDRLKSNERALKLKVQELLDTQINSADTFKTMYRRKRSPIFRNETTAVRNTRTRSVSPRAAKSEGWASDKSFYEKSTKGQRTKSPASSLVSSPREGLTRNKGNNNNKARSRSSSAGSNGSATTRSKKSDNLRDLVRSSEADFKSLEERMQWLQRLLKAP